MAYELNGGYPSETDIKAYLAGMGIEYIQENDPEFMVHYLESLYCLIKGIEWALALGVYLPSATSFNVRGGHYLFGGSEQEYSSEEEAIDPADNDTTYVWMADDNMIGYGVDGDGWPEAEHIKLAELDVDGDGAITELRDLRGQTFLVAPRAADGRTCANLGANGGLAVIFSATLTAGSTVQIHDADAPYKYRVIRAWSIAKGTDAGTWKLTDGTNDITDAVAVTATDKTVNQAATIDDLYNEISADGSLVAVGDGSLADVDIYVEAVRVP